MTEKHIVLEDIDPVMLYGAANGHLQIIKSLYPKLRIVARGNVLRVLGDHDEMERFDHSIELMRQHVLKFNTIGEEDIIDIVHGNKTKAEGTKGVIVYSVTGRPIKARSENQQRLVEAYEQNDMVFADIIYDVFIHQMNLWLFAEKRGTLSINVKEH